MNLYFCLCTDIFFCVLHIGATVVLGLPRLTEISVTRGFRAHGSVRFVFSRFRFGYFIKTYSDWISL